MRAKPVLMAALLSAVLYSPLALADEVVEFQDGRYLKVESHEVLDASIRLNVSRDSYVIFPLSRVDRIERNGKEVFRQPDPVAVRADGSEACPTESARPADVVYNVHVSTESGAIHDGQLLAWKEEPSEIFRAVEAGQASRRLSPTVDVASMGDAHDHDDQAIVLY
jgi:hypothetical protein